jgi:hypothetical protein
MVVATADLPPYRCAKMQPKVANRGYNLNQQHWC